jgi:precorrin-6A/cobalt-precorrin-6A reductase
VRPVADRLLILGGTGEAVALAKAVDERFPELDTVTSLAGATAKPTPVPGRVRSGGFGGADGLRGYLCSEHISFVVDATHPFAARIAANAAAACDGADTPRLKLVRPMWRHAPGDTWIDVADAEAAAAELARLNAGSVFLTLGVRDLDPFAALGGVSFVVRLIERPTTPLPLAAEIVTGRGPFDAEADMKLMERHRIDALVTKASGGSATEGKILAARTLGLPVVMIRRPPPPAGDIVADIAGALAWLDSRMAQVTSTA